MKRMKRAWQFAAATVACVMILASGCSQDERALAAARREGTVAAYERYLASEPPEPYRSEARNELASKELDALGPQPTGPQLGALLERHRDTAVGPEIATKWAQAEYRDEVLRRREKPDEMAVAARAWIARHGATMPEFVPSVRSRVNEAIWARLRRSDANATLFAQLLPAVMPAPDETVLINDLAILANNLTPNAAMMAAITSFQPEGMTAGGRRTWLATMARAVGERIPPNSPASLMRVYLTTFARDLAPDSWELVRQRYDDTVAGDVLSRPSPAAVRDYLADPFIQRKREEWQRQLALFEAAVASPTVGDLEAFVAQNPTHLLIGEARAALESRRRMEEFAATRRDLAARLGSPADDPASITLDPERRPITADVFLKSVVPVEVENRIVSGLTLLDTGLLLVLDERLSRAANPEGVLRMQGRDPFRVMRIAADAERRLSLFQVDLAGRTARGLFQPARIVPSRSIRQGDAVTMVGTFGRSPLMRWSNGLVKSGDGEMYSAGHPQVAAVTLERETLYDSGFLFTAQGDAVGVLLERKGDREVMVLGLSEAAPFVDRCFAERIAELRGGGPDGPRLEVPGQPTGGSAAPNPAHLMPGAAAPAVP